MNTTKTKRSTGVVVGGSIAGAALIAGAIATALLAFGGPAHAHATPRPVPSHSAVVPSTPNTPALPAAQVTTIQQELAQLNYYDGPINGVMNAQTVQAITYLQRDSDLPQTGEYNQITYLALQRMLVTGNNQMGD